jgi:hypothetical protein
MQITEALADALLAAINPELLDDTGNPTVEVYADDGGNPGDLLVAFDLDSTTPFAAPGAGASGFRKVDATTGGDEDFENPGLAAAGAGTDAVHFAILSQAGTVKSRGAVRGSGDADNGEELVLNNKNIAEAQAVTITQCRISLAAAAAE